MTNLVRAARPDERGIAIAGAELGVPTTPTYPTLVASFSDTWGSGTLASPRTADTGGTETVVDTGTKFSIVSGRVALAAGGAAYDPGVVAVTGRTRALGRTLIQTINVGPTGAGVQVGWAGSSAVTNGLYFIGRGANDTWTIADNAAATALGDYVINGVDYTLASVMRATGMLYFIKGGQFVNWELLWVGAAGTGATLYPVFRSMGAVGGPTFGPWKVVDLPASFIGADDYALCTSHTAVTVANDTATMVTNSIIEHTITAATGVTQTLQYHKSDASNYYEIRMDQAASKVYLYQVVAGVATEIGATGGIATTFTNSTQYRIVAVVNRGWHQIFVAGTPKQSYRGTSTLAGEAWNYAATGVAVSHAGAHLACWPREYPTLPLAGAELPGRVLTLGDSKPYGSIDSTPPVAGRNGYQPILMAGLIAATGTHWGEVERIGRAGYTTAQMRATIDADLAVRPASLAPHYILIDLSINDISTDKTAFAADLAYIVDACHRKWPRGRVGLALPWSIGANAANLAALIAAIIGVQVPRWPWCFLGPDQRTVLAGADNGATNMADSVHPNRAGHTAMATGAGGWQKQMGY